MTPQGPEVPRCSLPLCPGSHSRLIWSILGVRVPGHWGLPLFRAFKARGRGCLQSLKAYQCDSDSPFPGTFLGDVQKPPVKARNQVKRDCLCASWMTQICLSWSALSLGLSLLLTLSSLPGVPSPPSISKTHHQASLTDSLTQPARCYHGRCLLQSLSLMPGPW